MEKEGGMEEERDSWQVWRGWRHSRRSGGGGGGGDTVAGLEGVEAQWGSLLHPAKWWHPPASSVHSSSWKTRALSLSTWSSSLSLPGPPLSLSLSLSLFFSSPLLL